MDREVGTSYLSGLESGGGCNLEVDREVGTSYLSGPESGGKF